MKKTIALDEDQVRELQTALQITQQYIKDFCRVADGQPESADHQKWMERVQFLEETVQAIRAVS